jgi:hypothetical protein
MPVTKKFKENSPDILMRSYDITENAKNMQQVHNLPNIFLKEASATWAAAGTMVAELGTSGGCGRLSSIRRQHP